MSVACSLFKYNCEVMVYIVLTAKNRLRLDIWLKISQQVKSTKTIIRATWNIEVMNWQKASKTSDYRLSPNNKMGRHMHIFILISD